MATILRWGNEGGDEVGGARASVARGRPMMPQQSWRQRRALGAPDALQIIWHCLCESLRHECAMNSAAVPNPNLPLRQTHFSAGSRVDCAYASAAAAVTVNALRDALMAGAAARACSWQPAMEELRRIKPCKA